MSNSQEKKTDEAQDSQTIRIEMPSGAFEGMFRMMSQFCAFGSAGSSCCDMAQDQCCPEPEDDKRREFTFVVKRKD